MSARLQVPLSQRRHTNIAAVRYTKNGVKLEIACYKNKVISYRSGVETRLDEVLQVERVFTNISRGLFASEKEIQSVFGRDMSEREALQYILLHGELQVAQQERTAEVDQMFIDIAVIVSQKCVNPVTQKPFPAQVIEQALRSIGARIKLDQPVKKQALALMHQLIDAQPIPIARARMKLRCIAPDAAALAKLVDWCASNDVEIVEQTVNSGERDGSLQDPSLLILLQPHLFREIEKFVKNELPPGGSVHMVESAATYVGDGDLMTDAELIARANTHGSLSCISGDDGSSSHHTGGGRSSSHNNYNTAHDDGKRGKKGGKKQHGKRQNNTDNDNRDYDRSKDRQDFATANPVSNDEESDTLQTALDKLGMNERRGSSDDDADARSKRSKKKAKRRCAGQQQQETKSQKGVTFDVQEGSDDEVLVNRKQRKQAVAATKSKKDEIHQYSDDEYGYNYDYMEEEEEEEEEEEGNAH